MQSVIRSHNFVMIITVAITALIVVLIYVRLSRPSKKVPQGLIETPIEKGIPIIGILYKITYPLHDHLKKLGKQHGPIFRIRYGMRDILVLNDFETIRKALKENGGTFSGRFINKFIRTVNHDAGIVATEGEVWAKQRSFVLQVLRDFGLGKSRSMEIAQDQSLSLVKDIELSEGKKIQSAKFVSYHTANIISTFIMKKAFSKDDPNLQVIDTAIRKFTKQKNFARDFSLFFPIFDNSDLPSKLLSLVITNFGMVNKSYDFFQQEIEEHSKVLDVNSEGDDFINRYLIKQHQLKQTKGQVESFTDWQLIRTCFELFVAGYETASTTLTWGFMFLSRHPHVQKRIYNEILDQIGNERIPSMHDKKSLPYTQAVMDEIFRWSTAIPLSIIHKTLNDCNIDKYFIPKGILVFPNLFACHTDGKVWERPNEFYPEHFLSKDDNGMIKYTPREQLITFSVGPRQCLGESLARTEYFIFLIHILQKFKVSFADEISDSKYQEILRGREGIIRFSIVDNFVFNKRETE